MLHQEKNSEIAAGIELEIQALLLQFQTADLAADSLIKKYERQRLSLPEFQTLATFLLHCGFSATLADFILKKIDDGSEIPWAHFAEALFLSSQGIEPEIQKAVLEAALESRNVEELARSSVLDEFAPKLISERQKRQKQFQTRLADRKQQLLEELTVLKSQNLVEEEERLLQKMDRYFPRDPELQKLRSDLRNRMAQEFISKKPSQKNKKTKSKLVLPLNEKLDPESEKILSEIQKSMESALQNDEALAQDFAVAQMAWENFDGALQIIEKGSDSETKDWLQAELLLRSRRYLELLEMLPNLEVKYANESETVFAAHYMRAQALWGLDQKHTAIEILEGMTQARPDYRSAASLLREWKEALIE